MCATMLWSFILHYSQLSVFSIANFEYVLLNYNIDNKNVQIMNSRVGNAYMYHYIWMFPISLESLFEYVKKAFDSLKKVFMVQCIKVNNDSFEFK